MVAHTYTTDGVDFQVLVKQVHEDLPGDPFQAAFNSQVVFTFTPDIAVAKVAILDATVAAHKADAAARALLKAKHAKCDEIDQRTDELIDAGFPWAGLQFSLSLESQINWTNIGMNPALVIYPYKISTLLDDGVHEFQDAAEIQQAYGAAVGTKEYCIGSGRDLKDQVLACTTIAEVNAVVDPR